MRDPEGEVGVAGEVPDVEQAQGDPQVGLRLLEHRRGGPHRVVDVDAGVPERDTRSIRPSPRLDVVVVHQHHVQVGVRRELPASVAADRDQCDPDVGRTAVGVRLRAELVGGGGAGGAFLEGHRCWRI